MDTKDLLAIGGVLGSPIAWKYIKLLASLARRRMQTRAAVESKQLDIEAKKLDVEQSDKERLWERIDALESDLRDARKELRDTRTELLARIEALEGEKLSLAQELARKCADLELLRRDYRDAGETLRDLEQQMAQREAQMAACPNCSAVAAQNAKGAHAG